jgi:hypothetical protein
MNTSLFVKVLLKTGVYEAWGRRNRLGVPVSPLGVPVGVPVLEHRNLMKQKGLLAVFQCSSRFQKKIDKKQYLGVLTIVSPPRFFEILK